MAKKQLKLKTDKRGWIANNQSPEIIEQIVKEIEEKRTSIEEIKQKYGAVKSSTLKKWVNVYGSGSFPTKRRMIALDTKLQAVYEFESGELTLKEIMRKYKISDNTVKLWQKKYAGSSQEKKNNLDEVDEKQSRKQIRELKLKVYALETMIDLAEKQYRIAIRKKFGTKQ